MGEGLEVHSPGMSNHLCCLMKTIVGTSPVQNPHLEQAEEDQIVDTSPIHLSKPFCPSDHIGPEPIIEVEVQIHVPPPMVIDNCLVIWLPCLLNAMEGILGYLSISVSVPSTGTKREITSKVEG